MSLSYNEECALIRSMENSKYLDKLRSASNTTMFTDLQYAKMANICEKLQSTDIEVEMFMDTVTKAEELGSPLDDFVVWAFMAGIVEE